MGGDDPDAGVKEGNIFGAASSAMGGNEVETGVIKGEIGAPSRSGSPKSIGVESRELS